MDQWLTVSLRVIHILSGAAWVGGAFLIMGFIVPRARHLGPEAGGTYLRRFLDHPWFSTYITAVELLAVITGFVLFWNASGGLQGAWLTSPTGLAFTVGGIAGVVALGISVPISLTLSKLYYLTDDSGPGLASGDAQGPGFDEYHKRLALLGSTYSTLLTLAVVGMASAQYLN